MRVGNHGDAVLGQEFPDTHGSVAWRFVVVQKPGTRRSFVRPFPSNCISKALQNGYVDSLIHSLV
jgi:nitroreductase